MWWIWKQQKHGKNSISDFIVCSGFLHLLFPLEVLFRLLVASSASPEREVAVNVNALLFELHFKVEYQAENQVSLN